MDRIDHPDRLTTPLRRVGKKGEGRFEAVDWDSALQEVGCKLRAILDQSGGEAILPYSFSGNMGILSKASMDRRFFHAVGATELDRTICTVSADAALRFVYGQGLGPDPETIPNAHMVVLWGSNPMATNLHEIPLLDEARSRGAHIWTIDPLRTATARRYGNHLMMAPHRDYALALGLGHAILAQGREDRDFIERYTEGFDEYQELVKPWTRKKTLEACGLDGTVFDTLVSQLISQRPLLFRTGYGVQRQRDSAKTIWAISALSIILGTPKDVGGGHLVSNSDAFPINRAALTRPDLRRKASRRVNMLHLGEALLTLDNPRIEALIVYNSNPAVTAPRQDQVIKGLQRDDLFTIVHEQMMTDTARFADWVFPAAMAPGEVLDLYTSYWHRYIQLSQRAILPRGQSVSNTEFFRRLAQAVGLKDRAFWESDEELIGEALNSHHPWLAGVTLESLSERPVQRVGLAPGVRPYVDTPIKTPHGRLRLKPLPIDMKFSESGEMGDGYQFWLISPSRRETIKSSFGNMRADRPQIYMNPLDFHRLHLEVGQTVKISNHLGALRLPVVSSDLPGVGTVVVYAGYWMADGQPVGINRLLSDAVSDFGGGSTLYDAMVMVTP